MCRRDPEERWHIQEVMDCSIFKTGDDLIEQLQVCPLHIVSVIVRILLLKLGCSFFLHPVKSPASTAVFSNLPLPA